MVSVNVGAVPRVLAVGFVDPGECGDGDGSRLGPLVEDTPAVL